MTSPPPKSRRALLIVLGIAAVLGLCGVGVVLAIAIPNFQKFRNKSKRAEATYTLKALITAEEAFRAREGSWATDPRQLVEYANSGPQHFTCFLSPDGRWGGNPGLKFQHLPPDVQLRLTANTGAVEAGLVIVCAINLDDDPVLDIWSLTASDPTPQHDVDDLAVP